MRVREAVLAAVVTVIAHAEWSWAEPPPGIAVPCEIVEVYDGDTITVEVRIRARVRLRDCWAAELRTIHPVEKQMGAAAKSALEEIVSSPQDAEPARRGDEETGMRAAAVLVIPLEAVRRLDDVLTLGRLLADVYLRGDEMSLSERMVEIGQAWRTREELVDAIKQRSAQ